MATPEEVPQPRLLDLLSRFISRTDELLGYLAESERRREIRDEKMLQMLSSIAGRPIAEITVPAATTQIITQTIKEIQELIRQVIPQPQGSTRNYGSVTTTAAYVTVAKLKPTSGKKFKLTKIIASCPEDILCKLQWAGQDLGPEVYVLAKLPFTDWFPYGFRTKEDKDLMGDGAQLIELQVKYPSGGTAAVCFGELSGDEETA